MSSSLNPGQHGGAKRGVVVWCLSGAGWIASNCSGALEPARLDRSRKRRRADLVALKLPYVPPVTHPLVRGALDG